MPNPFELHHLVKHGNLHRVRELLSVGTAALNDYDSRGYTPLMRAVDNAAASVDMVRLLLEHGARIDQCSKDPLEYRVTAVCVCRGDPRKLAILLENGADIHYRRDKGYYALIDAVTGRNLLRDPDLIELLIS